jgi:hypothetical protein
MVELTVATTSPSRCFGAMLDYYGLSKERQEKEGQEGDDAGV